MFERKQQQTCFYDNRCRKPLSPLDSGVVHYLWPVLRPVLQPANRGWYRHLALPWNKLPQTLLLQGLIKMSIFLHKISFRFCPMYWIVLVAVWETFKVVTASNTKAWVGVVGRGGSKCLRNRLSWWLTSDLRGEETQAICWIFTANITCSPARIKLQAAVSTTVDADCTCQERIWVMNKWDGCWASLNLRVWNACGPVLAGESRRWTWKKSDL